MVVVVGDLSYPYPAIPPNRLYRQIVYTANIDDVRSVTVTELGGITKYYYISYIGPSNIKNNLKLYFIYPNDLKS